MMLILSVCATKKTKQKGSLWSVLEKLRENGSYMPEKQILKIFRGICSGLKAIHEKGYAHR